MNMNSLNDPSQSQVSNWKPTTSDAEVSNKSRSNSTTSPTRPSRGHSFSEVKQGGAEVVSQIVGRIRSFTAGRTSGSEGGQGSKRASLKMNTPAILPQSFIGQPVALKALGQAPGTNPAAIGHEGLDKTKENLARTEKFAANLESKNLPVPQETREAIASMRAEIDASEQKPAITNEAAVESQPIAPPQNEAPKDTHKLVEVVKEMATTEKSYVDGLQILVASKVLLKLANNAKKPEDKQLLKDAHAAYSTHLESAKGKFEEFQNAASQMENDLEGGQNAVSAAYNDLTDYMSTLQNSVKDYEGIQNALKSIGKDEVATLAGDSLQGSTVGSLLILPVQRGPRHLMLVADLGKMTSLKDKSGIDKAQNNISIMMQQINAGKAPALPLEPNPNASNDVSQGYLMQAVNDKDLRQNIIFGGGGMWGSGDLKRVNQFEQISLAHKNGTAEEKAAMVKLVFDIFTTKASLPVSKQEIETCKGHMVYLITQERADVQQLKTELDNKKTAATAFHEQTGVHNQELNREIIKLGQEINQKTFMLSTIEDSVLSLKIPPALAPIVTLKLTDKEITISNVGTLMSEASKNYNIDKIDSKTLYDDLKGVINDATININISELDHTEDKASTPTLQSFTLINNACSNLIQQQILESSDPKKAYKTGIGALGIALKNKDYGTAMILAQALDSPLITRIPAAKNASSSDKNVLKKYNDLRLDMVNTAIGLVNDATKTSRNPTPPITPFIVAVTGASENTPTDRAAMFSKLKSTLIPALSKSATDRSNRTKPNFAKAVHAMRNAEEYLNSLQFDTGEVDKNGPMYRKFDPSEALWNKSYTVFPRK